VDLIVDAQDKLTLENMEHRFKFMLDGTDTVRYHKLRSLALDLARQIIENCPASEERALALTQLDSAMLYANAAMVRNAIG
jgi:flagellar biosynthesis/type III secretory pathway protein FliH